jgi:SAM-dependent methyltransferase
MNALQRAEYVSLRMARRFLFSERVANRLAAWLPYYTPSANERHPEHIVATYAEALAKAEEALSGKHVLEVGAGRTNAVGYGLVARGCRSVVMLEPFIDFDRTRDEAVRNANAALALIDPASVTRARNFSDVPLASVELVLSNSVLEHVSDLSAFFSGCLRVLSANGAMLHVVDYRDHFFKYPYAFLTYSEATWNRWLNPGDLPRWRVYDHIDAMHAAGFQVTILHQESNSAEFEKVQPELDSAFRPKRDGLEVTRAILLARKKSDSSSTFSATP